MELIAALAIAVGSWFSVPGGSWQPNDQQVEEARSQIMPYVSSQASMSRQRLNTWSEYSFQYQGRQWRGKQVIYVNAFCSEPPPTVATQMVQVFDGGACYFNAYWDPIEKIYLHILFNGQA